LTSQIEPKLSSLNAQKLQLEDSIKENESLGHELTILVESKANPREVSKFKLHIEDIDKITSLLVGLSGRLARVESSLVSLDSEDSCNLEKVWIDLVIFLILLLLFECREFIILRIHDNFFALHW
jgi:hypothetical protein